MKRIIENLAVALVVVLFLVVIVLIIRYNMIGEHEDNLYVVPDVSAKPETRQEKTKDYLNSLESYGNDVDVKVDPTKEERKNVVKVAPEVTHDEVEKALKSDTKKEYVKRLEKYQEKAQKPAGTQTLEDAKPAKATNGDTLGSDLDNILGE